MLGLDTPDALAWARDWLGIGDGPVPTPRQAPPASDRKSEPAASDATRNRNLARKLWKEAGPNAGTAAERYLRARGNRYVYERTARPTEAGEQEPLSLEEVRPDGLGALQ